MLSIITIVAICLLCGYTIGGDMRYISSSGFRTLMWISAVGLGAFIGSRLSGNFDGNSHTLADAVMGAACSVLGTALSYARRRKT